jgi:AcrR family transcriptional regulator
MEATDKKHVIMQTAERLFTDRRIHEITLDEVAREARVGKGTIYRYFEDKDDLFFQVATSGFDELCTLLQKNVPSDAPFPERLLQMTLAVSAFFQHRRQMFQMMQSEDARMPGCKSTLRNRWLRHRKRLIGAVANILGEGVAEGIVRDDISPEVMAHLFLGMLRARNHDLSDMPEDERRHDRIVDLFLYGSARRI